MTFLNPSALWWLISLIPLAAIYFLKVRPENHHTSLLFLWDEIFNEKKSSKLFKRLRDLISFLLMMLAVILIILALSRPTLSNVKDKKDLLLIFDNSASMGAVENKISRLDNAKKRAENIIKNISQNQRVIIATVANDFNVLVNKTDNQKVLLKALEKIKQTSLPLKTEQLLSLKSNKEFLKNSRTIFLTDGSFYKQEKALEFMELLKIGEPINNIGITAFDIARSVTKDGIKLYFQITSSNKKSVEIDIILSHNSIDNIVKICPVTVVPGVNKSQIYEIDINTAGKYILNIDKKDAFIADNKAYAFLPEQRNINIKLNDLAENEFFFEKCIKAFDGISERMQLVKNGEDILLSTNNENKIFSKNHIIFNPSGKSKFWDKIEGEQEYLGYKLLLKEHSITKFMNFENIVFGNIKKIIPPENAIVILETIDGIPLIYKTKVENQNAFVINIDPEKNEFFLNLYFPILLYSASKDLIFKEEIKNTYKTGDYIISNGKYLQNIGFNNNNNKIYATSLLNENESNLNNSKFKETIKPIKDEKPLSIFLYILALILLTLESILYHKRKVG